MSSYNLVSRDAVIVGICRPLVHRASSISGAADPADVMAAISRL
jgi:hypothetical protein